MVTVLRQEQAVARYDDIVITRRGGNSGGGIVSLYAYYLSVAIKEKITLDRSVCNVAVSYPNLTLPTNIRG